jgi:hypothetical protein
MEAIAGTAKFLALNGLTAVAALGTASRCRLASQAERLLAASILFTGIALTSGLALGLIGQLRFWPLLGVQAGLAVAAAAAARRPIVFEMLDVPSVTRRIDGAPLRIAVGLVAVAYLYVIFLGLVGEPFSGDELMYHLPLVASFAQAGRIVVPQLGRYWHTDWWAYNPAGTYLLYQWWVLPFGSGVLVDLAQLPYAAGAALATYVLARRFGARGRGQLWSALLFLAIPIVINQCKTGMVDVTLTFLFAAGLAFALATPLSAPALLLTAIAWGAVPGAKLSGMIYLAAGGTCLFFHLVSNARGRTLLRRLIAAAAALTLAVALLSGYWFVRNYWLKGSPIFPLTVLDAQAVAWTNIIFYGPLMPLLDFTVYDPVFFYNYETGAGVQFVGLALPAAAALAAVAVRQRRWGVAAAAAVGLLMYPFWFVSHSREPHTMFRFVLPAMPIGCAAAGWLVSRARRQRLLVALATVCIAFSVVNAVPHVGTFILPESLHPGLRHLALGTPRLGRFDLMGDLAVQDYRRAWHYLDQLPGAHDIAASHLIFSYPMLGADWRHRLHFLEASSRQQWLADLKAAHVDEVVLGQMVDPEHRISSDGNQLQLTMQMRVVGDESVAALQHLPPRSIRGVRIRYAVPAPANARVLLGFNRFTDTIELPLDAPQTQREVTVPWSGTLSDLDLVLEFVPRTQMRDHIVVQVFGLEVLADDGTTTPVPLAAEHWSRALWPLEYYWMESDPQRFQLAFRDQHYWGAGAGSELRIYEVEDGSGR